MGLLLPGRLGPDDWSAIRVARAYAANADAFHAFDAFDATDAIANGAGQHAGGNGWHDAGGKGGPARVEVTSVLGTPSSAAAAPRPPPHAPHVSWA